MDHPGFEEALSGDVGIGGNHMSLSPINGMVSRVVCVLLGLRWLGHPHTFNTHTHSVSHYH